MEIAAVMSILKGINGCTFATLDAETCPQPNVRCEITGERVILFTNKITTSGYANMVRRRLTEAGKDPDSFHLSDLPWGERIPETPFIEYRGKMYLQCIVLSFGQRRYFIGESEFTAKDLGIKNSVPQQGLRAEDAVYVHTYDIRNLTRIVAMGNEIMTAEKRSVLKLKI